MGKYILFQKIPVNLKHHEGILELMVSPNLDSNEMFVCLKIIHNIIKRKPSPEIMFNSNLIGKFINIVCGCDPSLELMGALAILSDIFNTKSKVYDENKKQVKLSVVIMCKKCVLNWFYRFLNRFPSQPYWNVLM